MNEQERTFVTSPCGAKTQDGVSVDLGPELRRTLQTIQKVVNDLYTMSGLAFGRVRHGGTGVTFTANTSDYIIASAHGKSRGDTLVVGSTGTLPAGLSASTTYYVIGTAFTAATDDTITSAGHGMSNGDTLKVSSSTTLPAGLSAGTTYYVINSATDTFKLSLTNGGAAVDITDTGTGTHYWIRTDRFKVSLAADGAAVDITDTGSGTHSYIPLGGDGDVVADTVSDTLTLQTGSGITLDFDPANDLIKISVSQESFGTIAVSGQDNVVADQPNDTLTLAGSGVVITTSAAGDSITFTDEGKCKVNSGDSLDYLEGQFADWNASPQYDSTYDFKVEFDTTSGQLRGFVDMSAFTGYSQPSSDATVRIMVLTSTGWTAKTPAEILQLFSGYSGGSDQVLWHAASGSPSWLAVEEC